MSHAHFIASARVVADALNSTGITADTYQVLNLTDTLITLGVFGAPATDNSHESLVSFCLSPEGHDIRHALLESKKILAIKTLRTARLTSLKEAKDAVEDSRVSVYYVRP